MTWPRRLSAAVIVILATLAAFSLPPAREPLAITSALPASTRGVIHVHTSRSDGTGTLDDVAAAAARDGLKFVIVSDHGDGTRSPESPSYRDGVLVIDAVEISTDDGDLVALGLGRTPYPLGGEGRDVVEDINRLGGMSIVAHPVARRHWADWTTTFDGIEWLNGDGEWHDEPRLTLMRALLTYPLRPIETLGQFLDRSESVFQRWDTLTKRRRVVAVAATDAHARLTQSDAPEPYQQPTIVRAPGYQTTFETFSIVIPQLRLSRDASDDARRVVEEIRRGHVFSAVDALATPAAVSFTATSGPQSASGGDVLAMDGPVSIHVASNAPARSTISLLRDGERVASSTQATLEYSAPPMPAVYRAEIGLEHAPGNPPVPWVVTNPIYVGQSEQGSGAPPRAAASTFAQVYTNGQATGWTTEASPQSAGAVDVARAEGGGNQLRWRWALGGSRSDEPYTALVVPAPSGLGGFDRITFSVRADKPMRVVFQLRVPKGPVEDRWQRSFYVDQTARDVTVFFDEMRAHAQPSTPRPELSEVKTLAWIIEPLHTALGTSGQVWIDNVRYAR